MWWTGKRAKPSAASQAHSLFDATSHPKQCELIGTVKVQELAPQEPKKEDPFEDAEAEAAEPPAAVKQEPDEEREGGEAAARDAEMADAGPEQAEKDAEVVDIPEDEVVHMPASQDDPGTSLPSSMHASQIHRHSCHCFVVH